MNLQESNTNQNENPQLDAVVLNSAQHNQKLDGVQTSQDASVLEQKNTTDAVKNLETPLDVIALAAHKLSNNSDKQTSFLEILLKALQGDKGNKGDQGIPGKDGKTPQLGIDYLTPHQIVELENIFLKDFDPLLEDAFKRLRLEIEKIRSDIPKEGEHYVAPVGIQVLIDKSTTKLDKKISDSLKKIPSVDEITKKVLSQIPKEEKEEHPSIPEILDELKKRITWNDIKNKPDLYKAHRNDIGYYRELSDVDMSKLQDGQAPIWNAKINKWLPGNTSSGGNGQANSVTITQAAHGFTAGEVLRLSGTQTYSLAQADNVVDAEVVGIVSSIVDANNFIMTTSGYVSGLSGLTADIVYFLDPSVAGGLTATQPITTGLVSKPIFISDTTTSGYFVNNRGSLIVAPTTFGTGLSGTTNITANVSTGVSGGQSIIGGTGSGESLTLISTTNATKGKIIFGASGTTAFDAVNNRLGVGTNAPAATIESFSTTEQLRTSYDGSNHMSVTTGSAGSTAFALTGTTPTFSFSQSVGVGTSTVSANIHSLLTTEQLRLGFDATDYASFTVGSTGNLTVALTGSGTPTVTFNQAFRASGGMYTSSATTTSNLMVPSGTGATSITDSNYLFSSAATVYVRTGIRGNGTATPVANASYGSFVIGTEAVTIASTGTHAMFAQQVITPLTINSGTGALTDSATLFITGAATGATNNYALKVGAGNTALLGGLILNRTTVADTAYTQIITDYIIAYTTLTAARTVTLITSGIKSGQTIIVKDEAGTAGTDNITVAGTIDGATNKIINANYGQLRLYFNGTSYNTW